MAGLKPAETWVYDIETTNWTEFLCAVAMRLDGEVVRSFFDPAEFVEFVTEAGGTWVAHFGGRFDHLFLLDRLDLPDEVVLSGSGILYARWRDPKLELRDTWPLWQCGLAKVGAYLGFPKGDLDRDRLDEYDRWEVVDYCRRDVEILRRGIIACAAYYEQHDTPWRWTAGSLAMRFLAANAPRFYETLRELRWGRHELRAFYEAHPKFVRGGRVEVFRYGRVVDVHKYDINSSYPFHFWRDRVPVGRLLANTSAPVFYRTTWRRSSRRAPAPILDQHGFGTGLCTAWLTAPELELLRRDPTVKVLDAEPFGAEMRLDPPREVIEALYEAKRKGAFWAKVALNGMTGKFGQKAEQIAYRRRGDRLVPVVDHPRPAWYQQPLAAAWILGTARATLSRMVWKHRDSVVYCDTDCVHLAGDRLAETDCGDALGQWKHEGDEPVGWYAAPKLYAGEATGTVRCRGVPRARVTVDMVACVAQGGTVDVPMEGVVTFRQQRREGEGWWKRSDRSRRLRRVMRHRLIDAKGRVWYEPNPWTDEAVDRALDTRPADW